MSKYLEAMQRRNSRNAALSLNEVARASDASEQPNEQPKTTLAVSEPRASLLSDLARTPALRLLGERLAPLAAVNGPARVLVSGCRPGDGASTVAAALAMDLSQRLAVRTVLVDCHPHLATPKPSVVRAARDTRELASQPSGSPRLDTIWYAASRDGFPAAHLDEVEKLFNSYQVAVIDLGVVRLDAKMLNLIGPNDPVLIVARYGHTERQELTSTIETLRATRRSIAGVVLNGYTSPIPSFIRRLFYIGG